MGTDGRVHSVLMSLVILSGVRRLLSVAHCNSSTARKGGGREWEQRAPKLVLSQKMYQLTLAQPELDVTLCDVHC